MIFYYLILENRRMKNKKEKKNVLLCCCFIFTLSSLKKSKNVILKSTGTYRGFWCFFISSLDDEWKFLQFFIFFSYLKVWKIFIWWWIVVESKIDSSSYFNFKNIKKRDRRTEKKKVFPLKLFGLNIFGHYYLI